MKVIGIDYGKKYLGLALGDYELMVAMPHKTVSSFQELVEEIEKERPGKIVLGLPLNLKREETAQTKETRRFGLKLEKITKTPVIFVDETFTSSSTNGDHSKAAAQILQTHFDLRIGEEVVGE